MLKIKLVNVLKKILDKEIPESELSIKLLKNDLLSELIKLTNDEDYKRKYRKCEKVKVELIRIYNEIIEHKRKTFTPGIFLGLQGKINCAIISRHVIENILKWDFSTAIHKINYKVMYKHHLRAVKECFNNLYELLIECYPERELKPYYFKKYRNVWFDEKGNMKKQLVREAIREFISILIAKKKYKLKDLPKWINYKLFQEKILPYGNNLSYMLNKCFNNSPIDAIIFAFPELKLKPYYFKHVPKGYWKGKKGKKHAKQAIEELFSILTDPNGKYKFTKEEVINIIRYKTYHKPLLPYDKNLSGMLQTLFKNSPTKPLELLNNVFLCNQICELCEKENKEACVHRLYSMRSEI